MKYRSTRGASATRSFSEVIVDGAASDGGLFVPAEVPNFVPPGNGATHGDFIVATLEAFGAIDVDGLVADAVANFHHPEVAPIAEVGPFLVLEMFWGPTLSFKDHALQTLARLMDRYLSESGQHRTILVATSGDTGSAAIEGFRGLESVDIVVLYPDGLVSDFQRRQMTTVGDDNVSVIAVRGDFDDCQRIVKAAFASPDFASANSINWGRIAAQIGYYMSAAVRLERLFDVVVPTGNFGNALSAHMSRELGASIRDITVATNANRVLVDFRSTGVLRSSPTVPTLAPAMDIQVPSNLERYLFDMQPADFASDFAAGSATDDDIVVTIKRVFETYGYLIDPHTAVAWSVAEQQGASDLPVLIVSTAHPTKFASTIEAATGFVPEVPEWASIDPGLPERQRNIGADVEELLAILE